MSNDDHAITYESAKIYLPGTFNDNTNRESAVVGSSVRFQRSDCYVKARIPTGIWDRPTLHENYLQPHVELVSRDLEMIDDLIPKLISLAEQEKAPDIIFYDRDPKKGNWFKIFDTFNTPPGQVLPAILRINQTHPQLLHPDFQDLVQLCDGVGKDENTLPYVKGGTLKDALTKAIAIYEVAEQLRTIS